jgi:hypothetical protein
LEQAETMTRSLKDTLPGAFLALLLLAGIVSCGQVTGRSSIVGTVTDLTGAVIVDARVVVTDTATNVAGSTTTNSAGYFQVDDVNPSTYNIAVTAQGFQPLLHEGITVPAEVRADFLNLFNHQRLAAVGGGQMNPTNAPFGQITQDNGNGRQIIFQVLTSF